MQISQRVYDLLTKVPKGKVVTYKQLALAAGTGPRAIGRILHHNVEPETYPCHRCIKSDGSLASGYAFGGLDVQRQLLEAEGVVFKKNGKVDLQKFGFDLV